MVRVDLTFTARSQGLVWDGPTCVPLGITPQNIRQMKPLGGDRVTQKAPSVTAASSPALALSSAWPALTVTFSRTLSHRTVLLLMTPSAEWVPASSEPPRNYPPEAQPLWQPPRLLPSCPEDSCGVQSCFLPWAGNSACSTLGVLLAVFSWRELRYGHTLRHIYILSLITVLWP